LIQKALHLFAGVLILSSLSAAAQSSPTVTPLDKQLARIDIAVQGIGLFNTTGKGPITATGPNVGQTVQAQGSNTFGALVTARYIAKPYLGFEGNFSYARYTEAFSGSGTSSFVTSPYNVQTNVDEETLGYVVTPPHQIFGFQPFASAGAGTIKFKPTPHGGLGERQQYRMGYYYSVGLQQEYANGKFGLRASFRQLFFLAPDFGDNYLTILKHTSTFEPGVGFFFRF
jgi:opacity protein-like surface antigen